MGATLSTRAEWTSAAGGTGASGKLEFSKQNESLLNDLARYVETLVSGHQREADVVFKRPFQWKSRLRAAEFQRLTSGEDYTLSDDVVTSVAVTSSGEPLLKLTHVGSGSEMRAWSFRQLAQVLKCAGDRKLQEVQACLEGNRDPVANIMGQAYASAGGAGDASMGLLETHERLSRERMRDGAGADVLDELDNSFRLLILLSSMDVQLLQSSVKEIGKEVRLNPSAVENEVNLLKEFTGHDTYSCLSSLEFTSNFVFDNGCRSLPWRQVQGDIAYLQIKPCDGDLIYVTASTLGYFVIKGLEAGGQMNHEQVGKVYPTLVTLLKAHSHHFAQNIEKQEFNYHSSEDQTDQGTVNEDVGGSRPAVHVEAQQETKQTTEKSKGQSQMKAKKTDDKVRSKKGPVPLMLGPRSGEPTPKWKNLTKGTEVSKDSKDVKKKTADTHLTVSRLRSRATSGTSSRPPPSGVRSRRSFQDDSMTDSSTEDEEEEVSERRQETGDLPTEYWQIQKLVRYLKAGNQTATVIALCSIRDFDLSQETCQVAIRDVGGLEVLINLLETAEVKCKIGSLKILREISKNPLIRTSIADLGGLETVVSILQTTNQQLKCLAAETIANIAKFKRARRTVRQHGGITRLVSLLQCDVINDPQNAEEELSVAVARSGALALWSCSKSAKNKQAIQKAGAVPLLAKLLKSNNNSVLIPVVGTLQECASEPSYRELIRSQGMIEDLVRNLSSESQELEMHCASAIFKCAEDGETRMLVRQYGGLDPLVKLLAAAANKELLAAATGAIWKCAVSLDNVQRFQQLKAVEQLVGLLHGQPEEVLINVVGALGECAKEGANRTTIRKTGGIGPLVSLLTGTNQALLINVTRAVGACAQDTECMTIIDQNDGVRLLWSLLKSPNPEVQASAAWAICPCIENAKDAGEMVRSFVGGLELIVSLLRSDDREVLASVCAAIGNIAKDEENLAVITDHGVVPMLAKLTHTMDDHLRKHLAEAIARCCMWGNNRVAFGTNGAVAPLVKYLQSPSEDVHRATACALRQLSRDPNNCITMHDSLVVKPLLKMIGSTDEVLQVASADCISNIRHLALANEKERYG